MFNIFGKLDCSACIAAKNLLESYNKPYQFTDTTIPENKELLIARLPGAKVVPQIFNEEKYLGGLSELRALLLSEGSPVISDEKQMLTE